jgi:hypothetical protein
MLTKILLVFAVALLLPLACSNGGPEGLAGSTGGSAGTIGVGGAGVAGAAAPDGGSDAGGAAAPEGGAGVAGAAAPDGGAGVAGAAAPDGGSDAGGSPCGPSSDAALIVPAGLDVSLEAGGAGVLDLFALTLQQGPNGLQLYAALKNDGDVPACDAALKVFLYDAAGNPLGDFINGLYTNHFYLYTPTDGSAAEIAACASPGDVTMTEIAIPASDDIALGDVASVVYYYSYFALDAVLIDGLTVSEVSTVTTSAGTSYSGTVINDLDIMVSGPSITIFPLTCAGRPLGIASGSDGSQIPPGGSWTFQTNTVDTPAVNYAAYPSASFSN